MLHIEGVRFGRLIAIEYDHTKNHKRYCKCVCDCGNSAVIRSDLLTYGKTRSFGCLLAEQRNANLEKGRAVFHSKPRIEAKKEKKDYTLKHSYPRLYRIHQSMKSRCYYTRNKCFDSYGGRGIEICAEWLSDFNAFALWALSNGYEEHLTIDRIDVNGNYCPSNCRWITNAEQQRNKRKKSPRAA